MIDNFSAFIAWFKSLTSSLLSWFFDLTNTSKILLFVVPLIVMGAIAILFEFVIPLVFDLPHWGLNKQFATMTPRNTFGLRANPTLIPRKPHFFFTNPFRKNTGDKISPFMSRQIHSMSTKDMKNMSVRDMRSMGVRDMRSFSTRDLRNMSAREMRSNSAREIRRMNPADLRSFSVRDLRSLSARELRSMSPDELRTFGIAEIRHFSPSALRSYTMSSRIINSRGLNSRAIGGLTPANHVGSFGVRNSISGLHTMIDKDKISKAFSSLAFDTANRVLDELSKEGASSPADDANKYDSVMGSRAGGDDFDIPDRHFNG